MTEDGELSFELVFLAYLIATTQTRGKTIVKRLEKRGVGGEKVDMATGGDSTKSGDGRAIG